MARRYIYTVAPQPPTPAMQVCDVCPGDLVQVVLYNKQGAGVLTPDANGRLPHLAYRPEFGGLTAAEGQIAGSIGQAAAGSAYPIYRTDIGKIHCPFAGTLWVEGGATVANAALSYDVAYSRKSRRISPDLAHWLTLFACGVDGAGLAIPIPIPDGATHVWVSVAHAVLFQTADGFSAPVTLNPGEKYAIGPATVILSAVNAPIPDLHFVIQI